MFNNFRSTFEEKLISEVRQRPLLYNKFSRSYRFNDEKAKAWKEISIALDETGKFDLFHDYSVVVNIVFVF